MQPDDEVLAELTALRERVETLERELRARDEFIIAAAHELRNPVSPLLLHVSRLLAAARAAEGGRVEAPWLSTQLELFSRRLDRFMSALNRILDVSRVQSGKVELMPESVDLAELVRDLADGFERELAASGSSLSLALEEPLVGHWDRLRLEQIVNNLLSNAIRYGDSQPIELSVARRGPWVTLRVRDRGVGISSEDLTRIFRRFERAHARHRGGFGVGLWVVSELCAAMGGRCEVESQLGVGSVFTVVLPVDGPGRGE